jgi:hypothetical protein
MQKTRAVAVFLAIVASSISALDPVTQAEPSKTLIETVHDVKAALRACWASPNHDTPRGNFTISVRISFKRNGDLLGNPLITYTSPGRSESEGRVYRAALNDALARCTPLPFSDAFGRIMAGHPINVRFH